MDSPAKVNIWVRQLGGCRSTLIIRRERSAPQGGRLAYTDQPRATNKGVMPCRVRLPRGAGFDDNPDIAASATERRVHPLSKAENLRYGTGQPEPLANRAQAQPGQGREHREPTETVRPAQRPQKRRHRHDAGPAGCARPERHQGRVTAPNTYQRRWTSSGRRAPHRTPLTVSTSEHHSESFAKAPEWPCSVRNGWRDAQSHERNAWRSLVAVGASESVCSVPAATGATPAELEKLPPEPEIWKTERAGES